MEMLHTPAPWDISKHATPESHPQYGVYSDGARNDHVIVKGDNAKADAILISAAPELLESLKQILDADGDLNAMDFKMARSVIRKAEGK